MVWRYLFNEGIIKSCNCEIDERYFFGVGFQYPEILCNFLNNLLFLPERIKTEKVEKLVANLHNTDEYVIQNKYFKTSSRPWVIVDESAQSHKI